MPDEPLTREQINAMLRNLADNQKEVMTNISTILSKVSSIDPEPYSSAALAIIGYAFQLAALLSADPDAEVRASIARIAKALYEAFQTLQAADAAIEVKDRATFLNGAMRDTVDALMDLKIALDDPTFFDASDLILKSQTAVSLFLHEQVSPIKDSIWNLTFSTAEVERIYWSDSGRRSACVYFDLVHGGYKHDTSDACYGTLRPPLNDDGTTVFDYRLALPTFLCAITAFLVIGCTLRRDFAAKMSDYLGEIQTQLQWIEEKIRQQGLTALSPPDWSAIGLESAACPWAHGAFVDPRPAIELLYDYGDHQHRPVAARATIEYGAVEKFSGNSSIRVCTVDVGAAEEEVFNKIQLRVLRHVKGVYVSCGMSDVHDAIRTLQVLRNLSPADELRFTDWSLREIFRTTKRPAVGGSRSLRSFESFLIRTQPLDTPYVANKPGQAVSLRTLLCEVPA